MVFREVLVSSLPAAHLHLSEVQDCSVGDRTIQRTKNTCKDSQQGQSELHATKLSWQVLYTPRNQHFKDHTRQRQQDDAPS
eukprot:24483_4